MRGSSVWLLAILFFLCNPTDAGEPLTFAASKVPRIVNKEANGCKFRLMAYYGDITNEGTGTYGGMSPYSPKNSGTLSLDFSCYPVENITEFAYEHQARYNTTGKHWEKDETWLVNNNKALPPETIEALKRGIKVGDLNAINANGFYLVENESNGEPATRGTFFMACLFHQMHALCATGLGGAIRRPKQSLIPHMLRVLKTIEFIDTPAATAVSAPTVN